MSNKTISGMRFILSLISLLAMAMPAQAASFDCAKASTKIEHLICDTPEISKLDDEMAASYHAALKDKAQADGIKQAQRKWLKKLNDCQDAQCLEEAYQSRQQELSSVIVPVEGAPQPPETKVLNRTFAKEADKAEGIKRIMTKENFNISNVASTAGQDFCGTFLQDFKQMRGISFVEPEFKSDRGNSPMWGSYKAHCPDVGLFEDYQCEPRIAEHLDTLPKLERDRQVKTSCSGFRCTENFKLFRVDTRGDGGSVANIFYCERAHGPFNFPDEKQFDTPGGYHVVDLKRCQTTGGASTNDSYSYSYHHPLENYNGVIVYDGKHYIFDLYEFDVAARTPEKTAYGLVVWGYDRPRNKNEPKLVPKCYFATVAVH